MIVNMQIENEYQQAIQVLHWTKWNSFNFFELNPFLYYSTYEEKLFHFVSMVQYGAIMLSENLLIIGTFFLQTAQGISNGHSRQRQNLRHRIEAAKYISSYIIW